MSSWNRWLGVHRGWLVAASTASLLLITTGCSMDKDSGNPLPSRSSSAVEEEVSSLSSRVLDMLKVKGKVTEPGAYTSSCTADGSEGVWVRHPWSMYGIDNSELGEGFANLKRSLPGDGWEIVKEGDDGSRNKNPEIRAVHHETRSQLEVRWLKGLDGNTPLLDVTLYSQCFEKAE